MTALILWWDRVIMALTREDELCTGARANGGYAQECVRRYRHRGRHVWRNL